MFFPSRVPAETTKISKTQHSNNTTWKMLNQYRVIRLLGRGTHGAVKYGEDMSKADPLDPDYAVAIKIIKRIPGRGNTIITSARIRYEIAVMKRCIHDNIVRLIEVIDDPRSYAVFLVMEYLEGGEIKWRGYDGPLLSLHQIRRITRDVLLGLEYLHYMGIIHRDIKPSNMLWTRGRAKVKLSDFGVSRFSKPLKPHISEGDSAYEDNDSHLNKAEGTPAFYAPEQAYKQIGLPSPTFPSGKRPPGANVDQIYPMTRALDVWAFGASIYCFLFGKPPYWGLNVHAVCNDIIESDYIIPPHATVDQLSVNSDDPNMQQVLELMKGMMTKPVYLRMTLSQAKVLPWLTGDLEHPETWLRETDLEADLEAGGSVMRSEIDPVNALVPKDHSLHVSSIMKALFIRKENDQSQQQGRVDTRFIGGEYPLSLEQSTHPTLPSPRSTYRPSADLPAPPIGSYASTLTASSPAHFGDSYLGRSANVMPKPKADELKQVINSFLRKNKVLSSAEAIVTPVLISPMHHADHDMSAFSSPSSATGFLQGTPPISVVDYQDLDPVLITYSSEELDDDEEGDVQLLGFGGYEAYNLVSRNAPSPSETLVGGISDVTKKQLSTISDTSKLLTGDDFPRPTTPPLPGSSFAVDSQSTIPPTPSPNTSAVVYPQSHTMVSPTSNHRQLFNERLQRYQLSARFDFKSEGPQHAQKWRCFCYILNTFVGCSHWYTNKAAAKEEAAGHALEWLDKFGYH
ncbi:kinase-like protein [Serendipita vermifera]|nr:kinase-like protein [Serendipita vermifera]